LIKRFFDIVISAFGIAVLSPVFIILFVAVKLSSKGPAIYVQKRVGLHGKDFNLYKFRSMYVDSDKKGLLTVGGKDSRITKAGYFLRKYKLDELPQLLNVFKGDMSFVGPRPEVKKYVALYTEEQKRVLDVRPGITDMASIKYKNENEILQGKEDAEKYYVESIMPDKLRINLEYIRDRSLMKDLKVIFMTLTEITK
jgi:lipopolysaccharide/colanic/teichoic acid biosynthesis glycosyltransferase